MLKYLPKTLVLFCIIKSNEKKYFHQLFLLHVNKNNIYLFQNNKRVECLILMIGFIKGFVKISIDPKASINSTLFLFLLVIVSLQFFD